MCEAYFASKHCSFLRVKSYSIQRHTWNISHLKWLITKGTMPQMACLCLTCTFRETITFSTLGRETSSSKVPLGGDMFGPRKAYICMVYIYVWCIYINIYAYISMLQYLFLFVGRGPEGNNTTHYRTETTRLKVKKTSKAIGIEDIHYPSQKMSQSPKGGNTTCSIIVYILTGILAVTSQSTSMQVGCIFPIIQVHSTLNQSIIRIIP